LSNTSLFGKTVKRQTVPSFTLTERVYPPFFRTPEHAHKSPLFCLVLDGNYTETYGNKKRECSRASALFHASDEPHAEHFHAAGGNSFIVEISTDWIKSIRDRVDFPNMTVEFRHGKLPRLGTKVYQEFQKPDALSPLIIEGLMLEITGETARRSANRKKSQKPLWLDRVESYLRERFAEPFSLAEVAEFVEIHPVHLAQTFRRFHHTTVGNFIRQIRLENARQELSSCIKTIAEISVDNGFSDQSHFTRSFKLEFGTTPNEYRKSFREA
jgi:AraC family transcriptional regulator